jgi:hypothetical protein
VGWHGVHLVRRPLSGLLYQTRMIDDDECGAVGGMRIGRGNRSTRRKPAPVPLCPPQIPHDKDLGSNQGSRGRKPATNRLSYGTALCSRLGGSPCKPSYFTQQNWITEIQNPGRAIKHLIGIRIKQIAFHHWRFISCFVTTCLLFH